MHILVVEDEEALNTLLRKALQEQSYAVDSATDGLEALDWALLNPYDLIVLDINLPGMDGIQVCRELRRKKVATPILMLTARDSIQDRVIGLDSGADDYLTKPFAQEELLARVRSLLRRDSAVKDPVLRCADLELDTNSREVRRAGQSIRLTSKEYAVLAYLMRHPNRVLSRDMIAEHVWDYEFDGISNIVDVYIRYLRRKLDDQFEPKLIETIRGAGYRIRDPNRSV
jgi:DNA-binding response OmpR family regulator